MFLMEGGTGPVRWLSNSDICRMTARQATTAVTVLVTTQHKRIDVRGHHSRGVPTSRASDEGGNGPREVVLVQQQVQLHGGDGAAGATPRRETALEHLIRDGARQEVLWADRQADR